MPKPVQTPEFTLIGRRLPDWQATVILDIGANIGQSARGFAAAFPDATVHSFEPFPASYRKLVLNTAHLPNIMPHQIGLGRRDAVMQMTDGEVLAQNHLLAADAVEENSVEVEVRQGAGLLASLGVSDISFIKIDTEGHDLDVLHGLAATLPRVDFIQVEAGMNAYNTTHVPYQQLADFMDKHGFLLFHFFEQVFEFKQGGRPVLRRANPLFINARLVDLDGIF